MAYGMEIYKPDGTVRLDSEDLMTRLIDVFRVGPEESGTKTVSGFDDTKGTAVAVPDSEAGTTHHVTTNGSDVSYEPALDETQTNLQPWLVASYIYVFHWK